MSETNLNVNFHKWGGVFLLVFFLLLAVTCEAKNFNSEYLKAQTALEVEKTEQKRIDAVENILKYGPRDAAKDLDQFKRSPVPVEAK